MDPVDFRKIKATWQVVGIVLAIFFGFPSLYLIWSFAHFSEPTPAVVYCGLAVLGGAFIIWGAFCVRSLLLNNARDRLLAASNRKAALATAVPPPVMSTEDLQFTTIEPALASSPADSPTRQSCAICRRPIDAVYFALADKTICAACRAKVEAPPDGSRWGRVFEATWRGLGAGLVGAVVWFAIRRIANVEIGLVAIVVGFMVGKAVRKGSGGRGGRGYQILAVVLTYSCIAANYMPDIVEAIINKPHAALPIRGTRSQSASRPQDVSGGAGENDTKPNGRSNSPPQSVGIGKTIGALFLVFGLVFVMSLAIPFAGGASNLIGLLIIGFALWQAWKLNAQRRLLITGPYQLARPHTSIGNSGLADATPTVSP